MIKRKSQTVAHGFEDVDKEYITLYCTSQIFITCDN